MGRVVSLAAVFSIVTQGGALRDDTKNGCEGDYGKGGGVYILEVESSNG